MLQFGHDVGVVETMQHSAFGECIGMLQFGHDVGVVETLSNGADRWLEIGSLQFGHDVGVVETRRICNGSSSWERASIRPRRWSRGD